MTKTSDTWMSSLGAAAGILIHANLPHSSLPPFTFTNILKRINEKISS